MAKTIGVPYLTQFTVPVVMETAGFVEMDSGQEMAAKCKIRAANVVAIFRPIEKFLLLLYKFEKNDREFSMGMFMELASNNALGLVTLWR